MKIYGPIIFLAVSVGLVWADENNPATQLQQTDAKTIAVSSNSKMDAASQKTRTNKNRLRVRATVDVVDPQRPIQDVFKMLRSQPETAGHSDLRANARGAQKEGPLDPNQREAASHGRARSDADRERHARGERPYSTIRERLSDERRLGTERPER